MPRSILIPSLLLLGCVESRRAATGGDALDGATTTSDAARAGIVRDGSRTDEASDVRARSWADDLTGHWRYDHIGNCIMAQEWWSFGAEGAFTHTIVDRNACYPEGHGVFPSQGTFEALPNNVLSMRWRSADGTWFGKARTVAIVEPQARPASRPDYTQGRRGLNHKAYSRSNGGRSWHREERDIHQGPEPADFWDRQTVVDLVFDAPVAAETGPRACEMAATLSVVIELDDGQVHEGREAFVLACSIVEEPDGSWLRITADGFEESMYDGGWSEHFKDQGIWDRYPAVVSNSLYDAFRPVLFLSRKDNDAVLLHDASFAWLAEIGAAPPTSIDDQERNRP